MNMQILQALVMVMSMMCLATQLITLLWRIILLLLLLRNTLLQKLWITLLQRLNPLLKNTQLQQLQL